MNRIIELANNKTENIEVIVCYEKSNIFVFISVDILFYAFGQSQWSVGSIYFYRMINKTWVLQVQSKFVIGRLFSSEMNYNSILLTLDMKKSNSILCLRDIIGTSIYVMSHSLIAGIRLNYWKFLHFHNLIIDWGSLTKKYEKVHLYIIGNIELKFIMQVLRNEVKQSN